MKTQPPEVCQPGVLVGPAHRIHLAKRRCVLPHRHRKGTKLHFALGTVPKVAFKNVNMTLTAAIYCLIALLSGWRQGMLRATANNGLGY